MAARRTSRKNKTDEISEDVFEVTHDKDGNPLPEMNDATEITDDNSQSFVSDAYETIQHYGDGLSEEYNEMTEQSPEEIVEPTPDASEEVTDEEVSETSDNSETPENSEPETPKFDLPKNPSELTLSDDMLTIIGQRALAVKASIDAVDNLLKSQAEGDSSAAVLTYAESDDASANVKGLFAEYAEIDKRLNAILEQLTSAVKEEKGEVNLTPEQIQEEKDKRATYAKNYKTAIQFCEDYIRDNPGTAEDGKNFVEALKTAISGRAIRTTSATGGTGTYSPSTSIRPRLGDNGFIEIAGSKYGTFTEAVKVLRKLTGTSVSAGEIHNRWAEAAGFGEIGNWANCPQGDSNFTIGEGDKAQNVTIHFAYQK